MKKSIFTLALTTFAAGVVLTSCNSSTDKVDAAKVKVEDAIDNLEQAKTNYNNQYKSFKEESEKKIEENEAVIVTLKSHSKDMKKSVREGYEKMIDDLERRNELMRSRVNDYKGEENEKWESFKREFSHDMDELGKALKDLTTNNVK